MNPILEWTDEQGVTWYQYGCSYIDKQGRTFGFDIFAIDDKDAADRIEAIRAGAKVDGRNCVLIDADTHETIAESSVPDNDTGITH